VYCKNLKIASNTQRTMKIKLITCSFATQKAAAESNIKHIHTHIITFEY
jgi:hypothetical protein